MIVHDPLKIVADLRDHLARHDKPVAFLFGAGTSCAINCAPEPKPGEKRGWKSLIPAVAELTTMCKSGCVKLGTDFSSAWNDLETECPAGAGHPNIEDLLSLVRSKREAVGYAGKLSGLDKVGFTKLEMEIRRVVVEAVTPDLKNFPSHLPHDDFALWLKHATRIRPVEIFTTNYDIVIERSLEEFNIPVFDGFVGSHRPFFLAESVERDELLPGKGWARLWKIHGSINWHLEENASRKRIRRVDDGAVGQLILPSHLKYDESRKQPYLTMLTRLGRVLEQDDAILIACGFSFSDQHINSAIFSVLESRPRTHVVALQYGELSDSSRRDC